MLKSVPVRASVDVDKVAAWCGVWAFAITICSTLFALARWTVRRVRILLGKFRILERALVDRAAVGIELRGFGKVNVREFPPSSDSTSLPPIHHIAPEIVETMESTGLLRDVSDFYSRNRAVLSDVDMMWAIDEAFRPRILEHLCLKHNMTDLQCLLLLIEKAKETTGVREKASGTLN